MQLLTLGLAVIGSAVILKCSPYKGFLVYIIGLIYYPPYITIKLGTLDFSLHRILIIVLFLKLVSSLIRKKIIIKFYLIDYVLVFYVILKFLSVLTNEPFRMVIERESGFIITSILPFFTTRLVIDEKEKLYDFFKKILIFSIPLSIMAGIQCLYNYNIYDILKPYAAWRIVMATAERDGFFRADLCFGQYIALGMHFAFLVPLSLAFWKQWKNKITLLFTFIMLFLGALSTVSSGPIFSIMISFYAICLYKIRRYRSYILLFIIISSIFVEYYSNRHWYEVLTRLTFFGSSKAYHRVQVINEAFGGGMSGYWLTGYGYVGIIDDGRHPEYTWTIRDMTNEYVGVLRNFGLLGFIPFVSMVIISLTNILYDYDKKKNQWFIWCFYSSFLGWALAFNTVGALSQTGTMLYIYMSTTVLFRNLVEV